MLVARDQVQSVHALFTSVCSVKFVQVASLIQFFFLRNTVTDILIICIPATS